MGLNKYSPCNEDSSHGVFFAFSAFDSIDKRQLLLFGKGVAVPALKRNATNVDRFSFATTVRRKAAAMNPERSVSMPVHKNILANFKST